MRNLATSPLASSLAELHQSHPDLCAELGELNSGWFRASDLLSDHALLAEGLARHLQRYQRGDAKTANALLIGNYASSVFNSAIALFVCQRRVPNLDPTQLGLRFRTARWEAHGTSGQHEVLDLRFLSADLTVLAGDPFSAAPFVQAVSSEHVLRTWLRQQIEQHCAPLIERLAAQTKLGKRAQWALVADACAASFLSAGQALGAAERGQAEGLAVLKVAGSPLNNPLTGYVAIEACGRCAIFRARGGCCRHYLASADGEKCTTCSLRPAAERDERLRRYLERQASA